jgi:hypothetical protein
MVMKVFRPLLKINAEFSAEEFETALLTPNDTLSDIHIPLLKVGALVIHCCVYSYSFSVLLVSY